MNKTSQHFYTGCGLNRASEKRKDQTWIEAVLDNPDTRLLLVWDTRQPVHENLRPLVVKRSECHDRWIESNKTIFLGLDSHDHAWFAVGISGTEFPDTTSILTKQIDWIDLRRFGSQLDYITGARLAYARALVIWHNNHLHCGRCGAPTRSQHAGHQRSCTNTVCAHKQFPRIDPAVIMLIHDSDHCLLGRQASWPAGRHSVLAGYVEAGESLEGAVQREVKEEVGLDITAITYHSSQAWPFPSSIMLGYHARATSFDINLFDNELESAAWFSRSDILGGTIPNFRLPSEDSIAYQLIQDWLNGIITA